jgi:anti-sigma B factor antagonist
MREAEPPFRLTTSDIGATMRLVTVSGELDLYTAPELRRALEERAELRQVAVDLADVTFIDSTALALLASAAKRLRARGGELQLVCDKAAILRVLEVTGLNRVFRVQSSLDDAIAAVLHDRDETTVPDRSVVAHVSRRNSTETT